MRKASPILSLYFFTMVFGVGQLSGQANVLTYQNDNWRTGQNTNETH